jgi:hypothetical protein
MKAIEIGRTARSIKNAGLQGFANIRRLLTCKPWSIGVAAIGELRSSAAKAAAGEPALSR